MKPIFFTPGPSQLYPTCQTHVEKAFEENIPSISHRGEKFHAWLVSEGDLLALDWVII